MRTYAIITAKTRTQALRQKIKLIQTIYEYSSCNIEVIFQLKFRRELYTYEQENCRIWKEPERVWIKAVLAVRHNIQHLPLSHCLIFMLTGRHDVQVDAATFPDFVPRFVSTFDMATSSSEHRLQKKEKENDFGRFCLPYRI
jgi:hypothetical protein